MYLGSLTRPLIVFKIELHMSCGLGENLTFENLQKSNNLEINFDLK